MALEDVLKGERKTGAQTQTEPPEQLTSALEKELGAEDTELARELQRTRAEEIIARRRNAIAAIRGGHAVAEPGNTRTQESGQGRGKEWLVDMAEGLLKRGLDPSVVGRTVDYLLGQGQSPQIGLPGAGTPSQGISFTDMKELFKMGQESNKTDPTLTALLTKLTDKIEAVEKVAAARPPAVAEKRTAFIIGQDGSLQEVPLDRPILLQPKPVDAGAKSIEMVKEDNRHLEEVERLKIDKEHKNSIAQTLASIPEKIGKGLASQVMESGGAEETVTGAAARTAEMESFQCPECKTEFSIPAGALQITCPNCKQADGSPTVYKRDKKEKA